MQVRVLSFPQLASWQSGLLYLVANETSVKAPLVRIQYLLHLQIRLTAGRHALNVEIEVRFLDLQQSVYRLVVWHFFWEEE